MSVVVAGLVVLGFAFPIALVRVAKGPTLADRAAATDVCLVSMLGAIALLAVHLDAMQFLDAVIVASLVHFISTLALAQLIDRDRERQP